MDLMKTWNLINIYDLMIIALVVLTAYNIYFLGEAVSIILIAVTSVIIDFIISYLKEKNLLFPKSALITGLILGIVIQGPLWTLVAVSAISILSKHIIKIKCRHIFNPANFGLFIGLLFAQFLPVSQSWLGASNVLLVAVLGLIIVYKLKRYHLILPFFAVHGTLMLVLLGLSISQLTNHMSSGPLMFFTFYMLTEPVTSPATMKTRAVFGALAGLSAAVLYLIWLPAMLVGALFFADLCVPALNKIFGPAAVKAAQPVSSV